MEDLPDGGSAYWRRGAPPPVRHARSLTPDDGPLPCPRPRLSPRLWPCASAALLLLLLLLLLLRLRRHIRRQSQASHPEQVGGLVAVRVVGSDRGRHREAPAAAACSAASSACLLSSHQIQRIASDRTESHLIASVSSATANTAAPSAWNPAVDRPSVRRHSFPIPCRAAPSPRKGSALQRRFGAVSCLPVDRAQQHKRPPARACQAPGTDHPGRMV